MNSQYKILAIIPARKGSKGIRSKNTKLIFNKPLISWTIEAAQKSKYINKIVVSTDCQKVKAIAESYNINVPKLRPYNLSTDTASSDDVIKHELNERKNFDIVCMLQPTSPLRDFKDIDSAFEEFFNLDANALVSVCKDQHSPYWSFEINGLYLKTLFPGKKINKRRQELAETYKLNGAIYIAQIDFYRKNSSFLSNKTVPYIMPFSKSIDIDTHEDFDIAEKRLAKGKSILS
jgi:CMP-N,N'-diacetyllegionaminic acid synthase